MTPSADADTPIDANNNSTGIVANNKSRRGRPRAEPTITLSFRVPANPGCKIAAGIERVILNSGMKTTAGEIAVAALTEYLAKIGGHTCTNTNDQSGGNPPKTSEPNSTETELSQNWPGTENPNPKDINPLESNCQSITETTSSAPEKSRTETELNLN